MKKIFSILLSLAMLVSLGALTAAPVAADTTHTTEVQVCPELIPSEGTYDLTVPAPVAVNIILHTATQVVDVTDATQTMDLGDSGEGNWTNFNNSLLVFTVDFLSSVLKDHDDCIMLVVEFDFCKVMFKITADGEDSTLTPSSRNHVIGSGEGANTTVGWGCQWNNITSIRLYKNPSDVHPYGYEDLDYGVDYTLSATCSTTNSALLTITGTWIDDTLFNVDQSLKLDIDFECCHNATFTITGTKTATPDLSPRSVPYDVCCWSGPSLDPPLHTCGCCCYNVCTAIMWNNVADDITSVKDITTQQAPSTLTRGVDYWISDNNETLIINGCASGTTWGGLVTRLDASSRLARLLAVSFNDACNTTVILTVNSAGYTVPSMTPTDIVVDLDAWLCDPLMITTAYSGSVISLGSAQCIANVTDITQDPNCGDLLYDPDLPMGWPGSGVLIPPLQWMMSYVPAYGGNLLLLNRYYYLEPDDAGVFARIGAAAPGANFSNLASPCRTLLVKWLPDNLPPLTAHMASYPYQYSPTKITICPTGIGPTLCPTTADFNLDSPADVATEITWGNWGTNVTEVWASKCSVPVLIYPDDYTVAAGDCLTPSTLTIKASYLAKVLKEVDDSIVLTIKFDAGDDAKLTITAIGTKGCFIATAAGADAPQLDILREFRDEVLRPNAPWLVSLYYEVSPSIANVIAGNEFLKKLVMGLVVEPAVSIAEKVMD